MPNVIATMNSGAVVGALPRGGVPGVSLEALLRVAGVLHLGLVVLNAMLPRLLGWGPQLRSVSPLLRQVVYVHLGFIVLLLMLVGTLLCVAPDVLTAPQPAATAMLIGLTIFWAARLATQWLVYDTRLWRGKRFETVIHGVFTGVWTYFTLVFGYAAWVHLTAGR